MSADKPPDLHALELEYEAMQAQQRLTFFNNQQRLLLREELNRSKRKIDDLEQQVQEVQEANERLRSSAQATKRPRQRHANNRSLAEFGFRGAQQCQPPLHFRCSKCDATFDKRVQLSNHERAHQAREQPRCNSNFFLDGEIFIRPVPILFKAIAEPAEQTEISPENAKLEQAEAVLAEKPKLQQQPEETSIQGTRPGKKGCASNRGASHRKSYTVLYKKKVVESFLLLAPETSQTVNTPETHQRHDNSRPG
jgi:hypothetical protein